MMTKRYGPHCFWDTFWEHFPSQMHSIIYAKVDVEKVCTFIRTCSLNDAKARSNINDKSMKIRNLRFLVFCGEYNVKIVFYMSRGIRNQSKVDENQCKIDARKKNVKIFEQIYWLFYSQNYFCQHKPAQQ